MFSCNNGLLSENPVADNCDLGEMLPFVVVVIVIDSDGDATAANWDGDTAVNLPLFLGATFGENVDDTKRSSPLKHLLSLVSTCLLLMVLLLLLFPPLTLPPPL